MSRTWVVIGGSGFGGGLQRQGTAGKQCEELWINEIPILSGTCIFTPSIWNPYLSGTFKSPWLWATRVYIIL